MDTGGGEKGRGETGPLASLSLAGREANLITGVLPSSGTIAEDPDADTGDSMTNLLNRLKESARESSLGRMFAKKKHIYCIGAPKTGTMSVAEIFRKRFRAAHEPQPKESIELAIDVRSGDVDEPGLLDFLKLRDQLLGLDCEAAHYLMALGPYLVEAFPDSQFLFPVRHPRSWLRSVIDQTINSEREYLPEHHVQLRDLNYGPVPEKRPGEEEALGHVPGLHSLTGYLNYWTYHHSRVLDDIPPDRLFLFETSKLSSSLGEIAGFVGVSPSSLNEEKSHVHAAPERHGILDSVPSDYVDALISDICGPMVARLRTLQPALAWIDSTDSLGGEG